jgi:Druantia protein DruA
MDRHPIIQGRRIGPQELDTIHQLLAQNPDFSRYRLSRCLCELWEWRDPTGQLKDMAARALLLKLQERGLIRLPSKRCASPNRMLHKQVVSVDHPSDPITGSLAELVPLQIRELNQSPRDLPLFEWLLHQYHYLRHTSSIGLNLKYLAFDRHGRPLSCLLFGSAAWQCAARDRFIGWNASARRRHLQEITNNTRFLILPWVQVPHLASHLLGRVLRRLREDWQAKYLRPLSLVESFVDTSRFAGTCYRAANWITVGQTTGRTRQEKLHRLTAPAKEVWVYPLSQDFRRELSA